MNKMLQQKIYILSSDDAFYRAIASHITGLIKLSSTGKDYFNLVLAGGKTPLELFRLLATEYRKRVDWPRIRIYWSDERYVPHDHPESNYGMAKETLLFDQPVLSENVFPMPTNQPNPEEAALFYESLLKTQFGGALPQFDLILLGMGADCHIASLYPGAAEVNERERWVVATKQPKSNQQRLSLTLPVLNNARNIYFIVRGKDKSNALKRATSDPPDAINCPASAVRPTNGELNWWTDWDAAHLL